MPRCRNSICSQTSQPPSQTSPPGHKHSPSLTAHSQTQNATEKAPSDTTKGPSTSESDKAKLNDTDTEADDEGDRPDKLHKLANISPHSKRKRARLVSGEDAPLKRRGQRPRLSSLSSPLSSEEDTDLEVESDICDPVPAKSKGTSNSRTSASSAFSSSCGRIFTSNDSSKKIGFGTKQCPASPTTLSQQFQIQCTALEEQEWEVSRIVDRRWAHKGYEYKVRWMDTWLPKSELGNARRLLREFEARGRLQRGRELRRPACKVKG